MSWKITKLVTVLNASQWKWPSRVSITSASFYKGNRFWASVNIRIINFRTTSGTASSLLSTTSWSPTMAWRTRLMRLTEFSLKASRCVFFAFRLWDVRIFVIKSRILDVLFIQTLTSIFCTFCIPPPYYDIKPAQKWLPCSECDWRVETNQHRPSAHPDRPCCKFLCLSFSLHFQLIYYSDRPCCKFLCFSFSLHFHFNLYITLTALAVSWCVFVQYLSIFFLIFVQYLSINVYV